MCRGKSNQIKSMCLLHQIDLDPQVCWCLGLQGRAPTRVLLLSLRSLQTELSQHLEPNPGTQRYVNTTTRQRRNFIFSLLWRHTTRVRPDPERGGRGTANRGRGRQTVSSWVQYHRPAHRQQGGRSPGCSVDGGVWFTCGWSSCNRTDTEARRQNEPKRWHAGDVLWDKAT